MLFFFVLYGKKQLLTDISTMGGCTGGAGKVVFLRVPPLQAAATEAVLEELSEELLMRRGFFGRVLGASDLVLEVQALDMHTLLVVDFGRWPGGPFEDTWQMTKMVMQALSPHVNISTAPLPLHNHAILVSYRVHPAF